MCGIIGAVSPDMRAEEEVFSGLKRLEYRGYDSAGIAFFDGEKIVTVKKSGRVEALGESLQIVPSACAIGHTRWATHGAPTDVNAHPHVCGKIALVHNGIIENYRPLKSELEAEGRTFLSETDSEVVAQLIESLYDGNLLSAVARAVARLKGSFALLVICHGSEEIVAVRYKSPAIIGFADNGIYISSDVPALPETVKEVTPLSDGDIALVNRSGAKIFDFELKQQNRVRSPIYAGQFTAEKGDFPHFMIKEIGENARTVTDTVEGFFRSVNMPRLKGALQDADKIIITGCGTAYNAGLVACKYFNAFSGCECRAEVASELRYDLAEVSPRTLIIAVTQSGETADTIEALSALKAGGAQTVTVTNCGYSAITRIAHTVVPVCAGAEICVAATKSYLGQLAALYLTAALKSDIIGARARLLSVAAKIESVLSNANMAEVIARQCAHSSAVFFLGRASDYAVAVEASLKLKEVSYVFSDAYPAGELKHGTLALIDENTLSVFVICNAALSDKCENAVEQVLTRGGKVCVLTTLPQVSESLKESCTVWLLPEADAQLSPFLSATALQLVAYKTALIRGCDPDKPRNLAKSVTVE